MKKLIVTLALVVVMVTLCVGAAADDGITLTVSIANGTPVLVEKQIAVTDTNGDGKITIDEALKAAHAQGYSGGEDGYSSAEGDYGLYISKLWGVENGGSYGYYLNNASAMSLDDEVKDGDRLYAFVYTDTAAFSDTYAFFDTAAKTVAEGGSAELVLYTAGYDENWAPITTPLAGASITVNGEKTDIVTDKDGRAVISLENGGSYVISATAEGSVLVPPLCVVTVTTGSPATGDGSVVSLLVLAAAAAVICCACTRRK